LRFIREKLKPQLAQKFAGIPSLVIGDPAGVQRAQSDERSVFDVFRAEGFRILPAKTNALAGRISAVDNWLTRQVDGGAALLIDPSCKALIASLRGGYRYKISQKGEVDESPEKNHHSHVADAMQYACLHADPGARGVYMQSGKREVKSVQYAY
jgi:phage terminase large subunit